MALDVTLVNRNLHTRVTFMMLEFEDLFIVLGLAAVMNVVSRFVGGGMSLTLQYGVPLGVIPFLMAFKYGKPRGYLHDLIAWHTKPRAYCASARDQQLRMSYIKEEQ
jgi:thiamine transporter ThiT